MSKTPEAAMADIKRRGEKLNEAKTLWSALGQKDDAATKTQTVLLAVFMELEKLNTNLQRIGNELSQRKK